MSEMGTFLQAQAVYSLARRACDRAIETQQGGRADDALTAVLLSAACLEAFVNELLAIATGVTHKPDYLVALTDVLTEMERGRASVRSRLYTARFLLPGPSFVKGSQPYQDLDLLFAIRNHVLHLKPEMVPLTGVSRKGLYQRLLSQGVVPQSEVRASTLSELQRIEVAMWACDVVVDVIEFFKRDYVGTSKPSDGLAGWLSMQNLERIARRERL